MPDKELKDQQTMVRLTQSDAAALQAIADVQTEGNLSMLLRRIAKEYLSQQAKTKRK